ncbi:hypothetical protein KCP70_23320 [Salmonella enterica subsp. enterica]|nr:hypothetical protein KCP70_23320 [Salmonella enterica subsp. enterica]
MLIIRRFPAYGDAAGRRAKLDQRHAIGSLRDELPTLAGQHLTLRHLRPDGGETPVVRNTDGELVDASACRQARDAVRYARRRQRVTVKSGWKSLR